MKSIAILLLSLFISFNGLSQNAWQPVGPSVTRPLVARSYIEYGFYGLLPSFGFDTLGAPIVSYAEDGGSDDYFISKKYNGTDWDTVSKPKIMGGITYHHKNGTVYLFYKPAASTGLFVMRSNNGLLDTLTVMNGFDGLVNQDYFKPFVDDSGIVYITYKRNNWFNSIRVKKYVNNTWQFIGPDINGPSGYDIFDITDISLDSNHAPRVVFTSDIGYTYATKYNVNNNSWVGSLPITTALHNSVAVTDKHNNLYLLYEAYQKVHLAKLSSSLIWQIIPNGSYVSVDTAIPVAVRITADDSLYVVYREDSGNEVVKKYRDTSWITLGNENFEASGMMLDMKISPDGAPWILDKYFSKRLMLYKYNIQANTWDTACPYYDIDDYLVTEPKIVLDKNDNPYIMYSKSNNNGIGEVVCKKYISNSWQPVGNAISPPPATYPEAKHLDLGIDTSSMPVALYTVKMLNSYMDLYIKQFDGISWNTIGTAPIDDSVESDQAKLLITRKDTMYVAYHKGYQTLYPALLVKKFNGTNWVNAGSVLQLTTSSGLFDFALDTADQPCILYRDLADSNKTFAKRLANGVWSIIGQTYLEKSNVKYHRLSSAKNGSIYAGYLVNNSSQVLKKFDGISWSTVNTVYNSQIERLKTDTVGRPVALHYMSGIGNSYFTLKVWDDTGWVAYLKPSIYQTGGYNIAISSSNKVYLANTVAFSQYSGAGQLFCSSFDMPGITLPAPNITIAYTSQGTCQGTSISFTSATTNAGTSPTYQWRKNGIFISGATSSSFSSNSLVNEDVVDVILTTASNLSYTSNIITVVLDTAITWTGLGGDNLWSNPLNWSCTNIPNSADNVTIPTGNTLMIDLPAAMCANLTLNSGSSISFTGTSSMLHVVTLVNNGTINTANGTLHVDNP